MPPRRDNQAGLIDLISTGLDHTDLADLTSFRKVGVLDAPGEIPDHPIVRRGDLWELGNHRLLYGDSTNAADVQRLLGGEKPHLLVTDPPYGVSYNPNWRNNAYRSDGTPIRASAVGRIVSDVRVDWSDAWRLFPGDVAYVWFAGNFAADVQRSLEASEFVIRNLLIWNKSRFVIGRGNYHWKHEPCFYSVRKGATAHWNGARDQTTVWDIPHQVSDTGHGTQKPVECMRRPIVNNSLPGEAIYEPFSGSGTTIIAAELEGRRCFAMEIDPLYVYVAITRWQNYVGKPATLDGEPFAEVVRRRRDEPPPAQTVVTVAAPPTEAPPAPPPLTPIVVPRAAEQAPVHAAPRPVRVLAPVAPVRPLWVNPFLKFHDETLKKAGGEPLVFDDSIAGSPTPIGLDVEVFRNFFVACFRRFDDGRTVTFESSARCELDRDGLAAALQAGAPLVTFNGASYDLPIVALALRGATLDELKAASDRIVRSEIRPWEAERELRITIPKVNHVDLMEPNPSVRQGLKVLHARLHGRFLVDLPFDPNAYLSREDMNVTTLYCLNDLDGTQALWDALREPMELRVALSREYRMDLRSKSDAQIGEAIVLRRVEEATGRRITKGSSAEPTTFRYEVPSFIKFQDPKLREMLSALAETEFHIDGSGKLETPAVLKDAVIHLGSSSYAMGVGGLHSTEANRSLYSDDYHVLIDADVASQYPSIIRKLGIYPQAVGPKFLEVYSSIIDERLAAKRQSDETMDKSIKNQLKVKIDGQKIQLNGCFGKFGSLHSALYSPRLLAAVTLTGQLSILSLIERAEIAGIPVVSSNTDGIVFLCPRSKEAALNDLIVGWEADTGFVVERTRYKSIHNSSVNSYMAITQSGKVKRKGPPADPWSDGDLRSQMSKNPQMTAISEAVLRFIKDNIPIEDTINTLTDPRMFVTVIKVTGGAVWRGVNLGRVVRFYWSKDNGSSIQYMNNNRKVAKTDGACPLIELTNDLPADIDYSRYVIEANKLADSLGIFLEGF